MSLKESSGEVTMEHDTMKQKQLMDELESMQRRISELEEAEAKRKQTQEELTLSLEKVRRTLAGTVNALAVTVEMRDPYTAGHQQRVTQLACAIGAAMSAEEA